MYAVVFHAHQKIDKIAYQHLGRLLPRHSFFPSLPSVLHFEGGKGPDGAKLKKDTNVDQPWHFIDPQDLTDVRLHAEIESHYGQLVDALRKKDEVRAGFEAAWLAHALVDGLTPAHHYPYEKELHELRGEERHNRKGIIGRAMVQGDNPGQSVLRTLKLIGPKGLLTSHAMFEAGAYAVIAPLKFKRALPSPKDLELITHQGVVGLFRHMSQEIAELKMYERFIFTGWNQRLSRDIRQEMAPRMVRMVLVAWLSAARAAEQEPEAA